MNEDIKASDYEALYNCGLARYDKGDYDAAIADYTAALAVKPDYPQALCARSFARYVKGHREKGGYEASLADYDAALALKPDHTDARDNRFAAAALLKAARFFKR